jgi:hypothetical protein
MVSLLLDKSNPAFKEIKLTPASLYRNKNDKSLFSFSDGQP